MMGIPQLVILESAEETTGDQLVHFAERNTLIEKQKNDIAYAYLKFRQ